MDHFCQPTSVAIAPGGEIVVADGYCNNRIVLFDSRGNPKYSIGERTCNIIFNAKYLIYIIFSPSSKINKLKYIELKKLIYLCVAYRLGVSENPTRPDNLAE